MSWDDPDDDYQYHALNQAPRGPRTPVCRGCREFVTGQPVEWNGWSWCAGCVPEHVVIGREQASRDDVAVGK